MPFINAKVTKELSTEKKDELKAALAKAVGLIGKAETWVMVDIEDKQDIWLGGEKKESAGYVSIELVGKADENASLTLSKAVCNVMENTLSIPADSTYITIKEFDGYHWGWNKQTF